MRLSTITLFMIWYLIVSTASATPQCTTAPEFAVWQYSTSDLVKLQLPQAHLLNELSVNPTDNLSYSTDGHSLYSLSSGGNLNLVSTLNNPINSLSFHPNGELWGWSSISGLLKIVPQTGVTTAAGLWGSMDVKSIAWDNLGTQLYALVFDGEYNSLQSTADGNSWNKVCGNLPANTRGLMSRKDGLLIYNQRTSDAHLNISIYDPKSCTPLETIQVPDTATFSQQACHLNNTHELQAVLSVANKADDIFTESYTLSRSSDIAVQDGNSSGACTLYMRTYWIGTGFDVAHSALGLRLHGKGLPKAANLVGANLQITNNFLPQAYYPVDFEIKATTNPTANYCNQNTLEDVVTTSRSTPYSFDTAWQVGDILNLDVMNPLRELDSTLLSGDTLGFIIKGKTPKKNHRWFFKTHLFGSTVDPITSPRLSLAYRTESIISNQDALLSYVRGLAGFQAAEFTKPDLLSLTLNNQKTSWQLNPVSQDARPSDGQIHVKNIGDVNGDGVDDYKVLYPSGETQIIYDLGVIHENIPVLVAPPLDPTVTSLFDERVSFLYSGANPVQTGVATGTINPLRAAVMRGKVLNIQGEALPGVQLTVLNHPEFGKTFSRADGQFDLVVNGGGILVLEYQKNNYLRVQRTLDVPWQNYAHVEDVVMLTLDKQVSHVDLSTNTAQIAQGSVVQDVDGSRQVSIYFPAGTTAMMELPDGSKQPLSKLSVRATEYTVGPLGRKAMPADLPPTTGYTFAVELSVDEAVAKNAKHVLFNQVVPAYLDNFLKLPTGVSVPAAVYDYGKAAWIEEDSGRIIEILQIVDGVAILDVQGKHQAATAPELADLGITEAEQRQLAKLYTVGKSVWRMPLQHFSTGDWNYISIPPDGALPPPTPDFKPQPDPFPTDPLPPLPPLKDILPTSDGKSDAPLTDPCPSVTNASIIENTSQILGETLGIDGSPFSLNYRTDRVDGYLAENTLLIPFKGDDANPKFLRQVLYIEIAGNLFVRAIYRGTKPFVYKFVWDGKDVYGRTVQGKQTVRLKLGNVYESGGFIKVGGGNGTSRGAGTGWVSTPTANDILIAGRDSTDTALWSGWAVTTIGTPWDARGNGFGGWTLNAQHNYSPVSKILVLGNGSKRSYDMPILGGQISTARQGNIDSAIAMGPDGSIYVAIDQGTRIERIKPDGTISVIAGKTGYPYPVYSELASENGKSALEARLNNIVDIKVASDNSVYIVHNIYPERSGVIRKISPDGLINTVVGGGQLDYNQLELDGKDKFKGLVATQVKLPILSEMTLTPEGGIYLVDATTDLGIDRLYLVDPKGVITTFYKSVTGYALGWFYSLTQDKQGNLYAIRYIEGGNTYLLKISPTSEVTTITAFDKVFPAPTYRFLEKVSIGVDGALYVVAHGAYGIELQNNKRVLRLGSDGIATIIAGGGQQTIENSAATTFDFGYSLDKVLQSPDGTLYLTNAHGKKLYHITSALPGVGFEDISIASADGSEVYQFSRAGKHLATLDAVTGKDIYRFAYDNNGYLISVTHSNGDVTRIERDAQSLPSAIVAPNGQRTALTLNAQGYLTQITTPAQQAWQMSYVQDKGLLASFTNPRQFSSTFTYDEGGRLSVDKNARQGGWSLARTELINGSIVDLTNSLGNTKRYMTKSSANKVTVTSIATDGTISFSENYINGVNREISADGTVITTVQGPDPRFGMLAAFPSETRIELPSKLTAVVQEQRSVVASPQNLAAPQSMTTTSTVNGKSSTVTYDAASKTIVSQSTLGKKSTALLSADLKQVVSRSVAGIEAVNYSYDSRGRLNVVSTGDRSSSVTYNAAGDVATVTDALQRTTRFEYDLAGRVTQQTLNDGRVISYQYDVNGNLTGITPPSRPLHSFSFDPLDLQTEYKPPVLASIAKPETQYIWNQEKQLTQIVRPDGQTVTLNRDATKGRLESISSPEGTQTISYDDKGRVSSLSAVDGSQISYAYDGSLPISETWAGLINGSLKLTYNNDFRVTAANVNGSTVNYAYDNDGLLSQVGDIQLNRDAQNGLLTGTTVGKLNTQRSYSRFGELSEETASYQDKTLFHSSYVRDKAGRITQKIETNQGFTSTTDYAYDTIGRLIEVKLDGVVTESYQYDANGNRLNNNALYDEQDRLLRYGVNSYAYTKNGELLTKNDATYHYDVFGNLRQVQLPGKSIEYVIDASNRRVGKKVNGQLVQGFIYQGKLKPVAELDANGLLVARFVYGTKANIPDYILKNGNTYRIISDHLGSPRLVVDAQTGAVVQSMVFDSFGQVIQDSNPGFQPFGFAGGLYDSDTKLVRFGARDYDSETGRWTSKDPILFKGGSTNIFGYVDSDPINFIDPSGTFIFPVIPLVAAGLGALANATGTAVMEYYNNDGAINPKDVAVAALIGGLAGAMTPGMSGIAGVTALGGLAGELQYIFTQKMNGQTIDPADIATSGLLGAGGGLLGGTTARAAIRFEMYYAPGFSRMLNNDNDIAKMVSIPSLFRGFSGGELANVPADKTNNNAKDIYDKICR